MHGHAEERLDDYIPSSNGYIFQYIWGKGVGVSKKLSSLDFKHAWITCYNRGIWTSNYFWVSHGRPIITTLIINKENQWQPYHFRLFLDYSNAQVVTSNWNKRKLTRRLWTKSKNLKQRKRDKKKSKQVHHTFTQSKQMVQRSIEKVDKTTFNQKWSIDAIRVVGGWFNNNFRIGFWGHLLGFKMFDLGFTYETKNK